MQIDYNKLIKFVKEEQYKIIEAYNEWKDKEEEINGQVYKSIDEFELCNPGMLCKLAVKKKGLDRLIEFLEKNQKELI